MWIRTNSRSGVLVLLVATTLLGTPDSAAAQKLGLYTSPDCTMNFACVPPGSPFVAYVMADQVQQPSWSKGLGRAEFRFTGIPPSWQVVVTPDPALDLILGDPLGDGVIAAFYPPEPTAPCVPLFTLTITPDTLEEDLVIGFAARNPPSNPYAPCANLFYPCNFPGPSESQCVVFPICVETLPLHVRSMKDCVIAVKQVTWRGIKDLFR